MNHSSEIITSPVYVAPSWRWNEVPQFSFSNCSLVSYMSNTDCRFPVTDRVENVGVRVTP